MTLRNSKYRQSAIAAVLLLAGRAASAQSPSPALPPQTQLPALSPAPTQSTVPPDFTKSNQQPIVSPLDGHVAAPDAPAPQLAHTADSKALPVHGAVSGLGSSFWLFAGAYKPLKVPALFEGDATRLNGLIRDGKLYLTLQDAIALALENNLDVETERYNLVLAETDKLRAAGGGSLRGIDYSVQLPPNGVGGPGSPLLNANTVNSNPTTPTVTDLTSLNSTTQLSQSLAVTTAGFSYSTGPNIPLFDPQIIGEAGYLRRSDSVTLASTTTTTTGTGTTAAGATTQTQPLDFIAANLSYLEGFKSGLQLEAIGNNASSVQYGSNSQRDPFSTPATSVTLSQPLMRGFGKVNVRYLRIARTDAKISRLLFEQQVLETIYGTSRLYYDLVSLGENVLVKQEALRAASKQRADSEAQEEQGTLAPIELTRARALESSSKFDLIQARGLYKQEEIILRNQLMRTASRVVTAQFDEIVPTDRIVVPANLEPLNVEDLVKQGLARRPDLAQAQLQIEAGRISAAASRNAALPQLNLYANAQTRGASEAPYEQLGSTGTGLATNPQNLALGGVKVSTIYQAGLQLTLPLRNRVAQSDAARDAVQLRQVESHTEKLAAGIRQDIETAVVALQTAEAAYQAASQSRGYQEQLLDAERDKLSVGQSTELAVLQNEAYLAQAKSTEIAARSNWMKARIELDRALGDLLENNHIEVDDAIRGTIPSK
jgi:outer membrane protein